MDIRHKHVKLMKEYDKNSLYISFSDYDDLCIDFIIISKSTLKEIIKRFKE